MHFHLDLPAPSRPPATANAPFFRGPERFPRYLWIERVGGDCCGCCGCLNACRFGVCVRGQTRLLEGLYAVLLAVLASGAFIVWCLDSFLVEAGSGP
jgi:hypothetical protein